ncbi:hypothetical protein D0Z00_003684 [Geotrichum galactomycetum]|uniref:Uncharacterized protein n=1 Tax=Geotrichum galactomycetum TaxID=27317 RepID=A0ACB6V0K5_9ASCO|nr:hypothetical protein D0Z00_003684 [Geotrichum candidum]
MSISSAVGQPIVTTLAKGSSVHKTTESSSLFQIASNIKERLEDVPGIAYFLDLCVTGNFPTDPSAASGNTTKITPPTITTSPSTSAVNRNSTDSHASTSLERSSSTLALSSISSVSSFLPLGKRVDPVTHLWQFFRLGSSLCALFNALQPKTQLNVVVTTDVKRCKRSLYDFVQGCKSELGYPDDELFTISNVFSDNTTDLLKVIRTVKQVMDELEARHVLAPLDHRKSKTASLTSPPNVARDKRDKIVEELLITERKYVHDLEQLLEYQTALQASGLLSADTIHYLFPNLNVLIDFQRRFLIGIEYHAQLPPKEQFLGSVFINFEEGFEVYEGFASNHKKAGEIALAESGKLSALSHIMEPQYGLPCFLIKPIQRICKYPLLLKELVKNTPEDWLNYQNQVDALESVKRVALNVNETQRRVENLSIVKDLSERLLDWKGHRLSDFGPLLHDGVLPVIKTGAEREYHLYLFQNIILCCKESAPPKKAMTLSSKKTKPKRTSHLILKGRIYMAFITKISAIKDNGYLLHIAWGKDVMDTGFFDIRFRNEELLDQWLTTIKQMMARYKEDASESSSQQQPTQTGKQNEVYDDEDDEEELEEDETDADDTTFDATSEVSKAQFQQQLEDLSEDFNSIRLMNTNKLDSSSSSIITRSSSISFSSESRSSVTLRNSNITDITTASLVLPTISSTTTPVASMPASPTATVAPATPTSASVPPAAAARKPNMKVKLHYLDDTFLLMVPEDVTYLTLLERVERKVRLCGKQTPNPIRIKYKDEDDDFVTMHGDEDIQMALEPVRMQGLGSGLTRVAPAELTVWAA